MAFFDKISEIAKTASDKTGDMIEITKLNTKISGEERNIDAAVRQLGEFYLAKFDAGDALDAGAMQICDTIRIARDEIARFQAEIQAIKAGTDDQPVSAAAKAAVPVVEAAPAAAPAAVLTCPSCGASYAAGRKFCGECGAKLN